MKPTKNNFFCFDSNKTKMRFETEKKALNFIKFNSQEIEKETGKAPTRCYFCIACNSYHVTSNKIDYKIKSKTEHILEQYNKDINKKTPINGFCKKSGNFLFKPIFVIYLPINPCGQTPQKILPKVESVVTIKNGQNNPQNSPVMNRFSSFVGYINPKMIA